jgi:O-acetyl-ADP-ribose deacetylase (regulator of RNase III)
LINIIIGDLLEASEDIIVHQVNCQGKMGSGVAKQIRNKFPSAYEDYMNTFKGKKSRPELLGNVRLSMIKDDKQCKYIAHLFGQDYYGYDGKRYTNYESLFRGLEYVHHTAKKNNKTVAIPYKIGSDRGGADWDIVLKMIEKVFDDYSITIYKLEGTQ